VLSPLLANIALSALDEHFDRQRRQYMGNDRQRAKRRRHGQGNWKLIRYADDFVLMGVRLSKRCLISGYFGHAARLRRSMVSSS
jgi:retron-type reverse transcriptase